MSGENGVWRGAGKETPETFKTEVASCWTSRLPPARAAHWLDQTLNQPSVHKRLVFPRRRERLREGCRSVLSILVALRYLCGA